MNPAQAYEQNIVPAIMIPGAALLLEVANPQLGERVIDVACGTGIVSRMTALLVGAQGSISAVDISPPMLAVARSLPPPQGAPIEWVEGSALKLPLPDHTFDLALCHQGMQFFPDRLVAMHEMRQVLKRGGRVAIAVQRALEHNPLFQQLNEAVRRETGVPGIASVFSFGDPDAMLQLLLDAGFAEVEVIETTHPARFPSADVFVESTVMAASAAVPEMARLDNEAKSRLFSTLKMTLRDAVAPYVQADGTFLVTLAGLIGSGRRL